MICKLWNIPFDINRRCALKCRDRAFKDVSCKGVTKEEMGCQVNKAINLRHSFSAWRGHLQLSQWSAGGVMR